MPLRIAKDFREIEKMILFVYGSLKRGRSNHRRIADQQYLGEAVTEPRYRLIDLGTYPGMVRDDMNGVAVKGELWEVGPRCLAELDEFEKADAPYFRGAVAVAGREGVEAYFWHGPVPAGTRSGDEWPLPSAERGARDAE
jgi:gamma-glutamylaminecyclotransferase